ncbi:MAG: FecR family protein [Pseudobacter sp.]|uniref:FecR family protein n=1 Tax=Pseudobacter sp. TaxID=2045420 RepID=UPI003F7F4A39
MGNQPLIEELLIKELEQPLTAEEQDIVNEWLQASPLNQELYNSFRDKEALEKKMAEFNQFDENRAWNKLVASGKWTPARSNNTVYRLIRRNWQYAAAVLILSIGAGIFYLNMPSGDPSLPTDPVLAGKEEIVPGSNKAVLTIGDSVINLSDDKSGIIAGTQGIVYNDGERIAQASQTITLTTPRGGHYEATLPDGSKVWLNAASSIRFPSKFNSTDRTVIVTGEVFLEVAKNQQAPFSVTAGNTNVRVLGTSFNINAYDNEPVVKTTLVEGSVRVGPDGANSGAMVLRPGQQAVSASNGVVNGVETPDLSGILAWKNGFISFDNMDFKTVMRQLERWYDVKVEYKGAAPTVKLNGELDRQVPLTDVLNYLSRLNIKFERNGRTITVLP